MSVSMEIVVRTSCFSMSIIVIHLLLSSPDDTTQWEFNDERVLRCPLGISVDNDENVYVVGLYSENVVVISPDGQRHRQPDLSLRFNIFSPLFSAQ
jgi:hypothetical protein